MALAKNTNPHLKSLEQAIAARYGWQGGAIWRDKLLLAIDQKSAKLGLDELAYCRMAAASTAEQETLAELLCNSETRFFREPEQFNALRESIIPQLIHDRAKERRLDLWSAACSTGEEAYSLAICVNDQLPDGGHWKAHLLATDLRGPAIISASQGLYPQSALRLVDTDVRHRYFIKDQMNGRERLYSVAPGVRKLVAFRRANLYDAKFWTHIHRPFDLIICNNLLLYFHALAARQTVERIAGVLRRGGFLLVMRNEAGYINHPKLRLDLSLPGAVFRKV